MIRFLPSNWIVTLAVICAGITILFGSVAGTLPVPDAISDGSLAQNPSATLSWMFKFARYSISGSAFVLLLLSFPPIWKFCWFVCAKLGLMYPYINGRFEIDMSSNWDVIDHITAKDQSRDDCTIEITEPKKTKLICDIDIGLFRYKLRISPSDDAGNVIRWSRAISIDLIWPCDGLPHRLSYLYKQENQPNEIRRTDVESFYGAGIINVFSELDMRGLYWTNRNWYRGLNTAGEIVFRRSTPKRSPASV